MLRFAVGPDNVLVLDLDDNLPCRGIWLRPERDLVQEAIESRLFDQVHGDPVSISEGFLDNLELMIRARAMKFLGLARKAGCAVAGFDQVREALPKVRGGSLISALDGALARRRKIKRQAGAVPVIELFDCAELSAAIGKENVVHVLVMPGKFARQIARYAGFISGFHMQKKINVGVDLGVAV